MTNLGGSKFFKDFILKIQSFCYSEEEVIKLLNSKEDLIHLGIVYFADPNY